MSVDRTITEAAVRTAGHDHAHDHGDACGCGHDHHHHGHSLHGHSHRHGATLVRQGPKVGRNDPCPCGSGKKHKKCCGA